jgi:hypothetical protein
MSAATYSIRELATTIGYRSVRNCARNMDRAANYARDRYPSLQFQIKSDYIYRDYVREWVCVDGTMCRKSLWLTAIFCANNLSKLSLVHKFLTQEFMSVAIEELVDFFIERECCDAQILHVLLGLPTRAGFVDIVEAMLSVHQIRLERTSWEYYRQPKSYNYDLPLAVVKSIVSYVTASEDFASNPMREFVTRLNGYFMTVDARTQRLCEEANAATSLESMSELVTVGTDEKDAERSLDLTVPLLLFIGLIACLGWIHPGGCW